MAARALWRFAFAVTVAAAIFGGGAVEAAQTSDTVTSYQIEKQGSGYAMHAYKTREQSGETVTYSNIADGGLTRQSDGTYRSAYTGSTYVTETRGGREYVVEYRNDSGQTTRYSYDSNNVLTANQPKPTSGAGRDQQQTDRQDLDEASKKAKQTMLDKGLASLGKDFVGALLAAVGTIFEILGYALYWLANSFLYVTAVIFNVAFKGLVVEMGSPAYGPMWNGVKLGWKAVRDVGNTLFMFVLMYAAFNTVLGRKNGLDLVPRIIIVALLVNFSFLFATTVIDASNTLAAEVHNVLMSGGAADESGFSGQIAELANVERLNLVLSWGDTQKAVGTAPATGDGTLNGFSTFVRALFASAFLVILGGFFIAIAMTLVARFVTLVVLCVTASLAFLAYLFPTYEKHYKEWWSTLIGQSLYAPAILLMLLITTGIAAKFKQATSVFQSASEGNMESIVSYSLTEFFQFCVLIGLLYAAMKLARMLSEQGSSAALRIGSGAQKLAAAAAFGGAGFALRGSLGRLGSAMGETGWMKRWSAQSGVRGVAGRALLGVAGRAERSSFDFRKSGAAAALASQAGLNMGKVPEVASKGWKGVAEARKKAIEDKIAAVKKMDMSNDDKKEAIDDLIKNASGNSPLGQAQADFLYKKRIAEDAARDLENARSTNQSAATISSFEAILARQEQAQKAAEKVREKESYRALNKKMFGLDSESKTENYSLQYARSLRNNANSRFAVLSKNLGAGLGLGALALVAPPAALAVGGLASGRLLSGVARSFRRGKTHTTYNNKGKAQTRARGFFGSMAENREVDEVAAEILKKEEKIQEERNTVTKIDEIEKTRNLTDAEKTKRTKAQAKVDKHENAGKKND